MNGKLKQLRIEEIRTDGGTQLREQIDRAVVEDYSRKIADLPPVVIYHDGTDYWLADGFHRLESHILANAEFIDCEIHEGTLRDAILYSVCANANHGLRRTNADKRNAVTRLLTDEEWGKWSDRKVADRCAVGHQLVADVRGSVTGFSSSEKTYQTKHGTPATMNTEKIREANKARAVAEPAITFGDPDTDNEPTSRDERPDPDADEAERKAENKRLIDISPTKALEAAEAKAVDAMGLALRAVSMLESIPMNHPAYSDALEYVRNWLACEARTP